VTEPVVVVRLSDRKRLKILLLSLQFETDDEDLGPKVVPVSPQQQKGVDLLFNRPLDFVNIDDITRTMVHPEVRKTRRSRGQGMESQR
jgi:hypothetical protein